MYFSPFMDAKENSPGDEARRFHRNDAMAGLFHVIDGLGQKFLDDPEVGQER